LKRKRRETNREELFDLSFKPVSVAWIMKKNTLSMTMMMTIDIKMTGGDTITIGITHMIDTSTLKRFDIKEGRLTSCLSLLVSMIMGWIESILGDRITEEMKGILIIIMNEEEDHILRLEMTLDLTLLDFMNRRQV